VRGKTAFWRLIRMGKSQSEIATGYYDLRRGAKFKQGFSLIEVALALIVLLMIVMIFGACFPLAVRSSQFSNNYTQATFLAQHKIDQIRAAGWANVVSSSKLTGSGNSATDIANQTTLTSLGITDSGQSSSPWTFKSTDNLASFYGSTSTGTLTITPDQNDTYCANAASTCDVATATVTITWPNSGRRSSGKYTLFAKIIEMQHQ